MTKNSAIASVRQLTLRQSEEELETVDSDEELREHLDELAPLIGWVIIYFNSLEDSISRCIREAMLHDPVQDERMDVFLAEMQYAAKCRSLMHLYGQVIETTSAKLTQQDLQRLETTLLECSKRRNEYAHADWIGMKKGRYVRVKSQSKRDGITHRFKVFETAQLEDDIDFIYKARDLLDEFNERITDEIYGRA